MEAENVITTYHHWYPLFAVMIGTGLRIGEVTGLRWCDIDLEEGIIDVNHNLVYYTHRAEGSKKGLYFNVNSPKTKAGTRQVPMLDFVKEAFLMEKEYQKKYGMPKRYWKAQIDWLKERFPEGKYQDVIGLCRVLQKSGYAG